MFWPKSLALQKIPYTVNRIVDESPLMDQGYVFHGKKSVKLMAVEPFRGKIRWIHNDDDEMASKSRARSNSHIQQDTFLISRVEYTLYTTNAATGKLRSKVKISELSLLSSPEETMKMEDSRMLPFLVAEQTANGGWGVSCLDGVTGAVLWRRALPSQAVCGFYWDRQGAAKLPLHSLEEFVEAAMNGAESDSSIVLHKHKDSLFILPVPSTAEYRMRPEQFPTLFGDQSFEKSVALALISSRQMSLQHQTRLEAGADGRWFSSKFEGCGRDGRSWRDIGSCITGAYRVSMAAPSALAVDPPPGLGRSTLMNPPYLIGPGHSNASVPLAEAAAGQGGGAYGRRYLYFMLGGAVVWPLAALIVWLLATRGRVSRLQRWVTRCIDWAHSRLHQAEGQPPLAPPAQDNSALCKALANGSAPGLTLCANGSKAQRANGHGRAGGGAVADSPTSGTEHPWPKGQGLPGDTDLSSTTWATSSRSVSNDGSEESSRRAATAKVERRDAGSSLLRGGAYEEELRQLDEEESLKVATLACPAAQAALSCPARLPSGRSGHASSLCAAARRACKKRACLPSQPQ